MADQISAGAGTIRVNQHFSNNRRGDNREDDPAHKDAGEIRAQCQNKYCVFDHAVGEPHEDAGKENLADGDDPAFGFF